MKNFVKATCLVAVSALLGAMSAQAAVITYTSRAAFDAAHPGVQVEGFQNCSSATQSFTGPLNSSTNNSACQPGDILPGITFGDSPGPDFDGMFIAGPGQSANPTTAIGQNYPEFDALQIVFAGGSNVVAFDIFQNFGGGSQSGSTQLYPVSLFDLGNNLLGTYSSAVPSGGAGFFGAYSDTLIGRVTVNNSAAYDVIDNVAFGATTASVPEPSTLLLLGAGLLGLGLRRKAALG